MGIRANKKDHEKYMEKFEAIAKAFNWEIKIYDQDGIFVSIGFIHPSGNKIWMFDEGKGKFELGGYQPNLRYGSTDKVSIGFSIEKPIQAIISDIERRFIPPYEAELKKYQETKEKEDRDFKAKKKTIDNIRKVISIDNERRVNYDSGELDFHFSHGFYGDIRVSYDGRITDITRLSADHKTLLKVLKLIAREAKELRKED